MSKYYTPKIEEFHVGFEFESAIRREFKTKKEAELSGFDIKDCIRVESRDYYLSVDWVKMIFDINSNVFGLCDVNYDNGTANNAEVGKYYRVKYLDKEDIESLGFKDDVGAGIFFRKRIHVDEEIHLNFDNKILIERCCVMDEDPIGVVFSGIIKNKSELKLILKMIGA